MNIAKNEIAGNCKLKCAYNFNYSNSNCVVNNQLKTYKRLKFNYDLTKVPPVTWNGMKYQVNSVELSIKTLIKIHNKYPLAYLVITHTNPVGGKIMIVIIPIIVGNTNKGGSVLEEMIAKTMKQAPASETTDLKVDNYNLNFFVPSSPFYSTSMMNDTMDVVVFDTMYALQVKDNYIQSLYTMGHGNEYTKNKNAFLKKRQSTKNLFLKAPLYYNASGPNSTRVRGSGPGNDDIYIECNPVGSSDDDTFVKMPGFSGDGSGYNLPKWLTKKNLKKLVKNPWFIGVMVFIAALILYGVCLGYVKYFKPNVPELKKKLGFGNKPPDAAPPTT